ncbi:MAG: SdrD B-like domain-containing protein, partial [Candidatus Promineifilaceae bacterium]
GVDGTNQAQPLAVSLGVGEDFISADFGYLPLAENAGTIGNQLWLDTDGNGIYDPDNGEKGIPGVTVVLLNASGTAIFTTTTNSDGTYSFDSLPAGNYTVVVPNTPPGLVSTILGTPGADNHNQGMSYPVSLGEDEIDMTADFGFAVPASIGDFIWYDIDGDGVQDPDEGGLANMTVVLYDINGTPIMTTTTDANGSYLFDELSPGTYSVGVVAGTNGLTATNGPDTYTAGTPITLSPGEDYTDGDFGYQMQPTTGNAVIGDTVWVDANGDGVQDAGEAGIEGVLITITDGTNIYTTTTDASGHYLITVPTGSYTITATAPAGMSQTYDHDGTLDNSTTVTLLDGDQFLGADFGYNETTPGTLLGTIGNQIWEDTNGDGDFDAGEAGIADVTVNLVDSSGAVVATVATDINGEYLFTGVPAGNYTVVVADTNGVLDEYTPTQLGTPNTDNHSQSDPYPVTLAAGDSVVSADFGYLHNGPSSNNSSVGDQVWFDIDGDGVYEPENGEYGISDVPIGLYDSNGTLVMTTTTDADGSYLFDNLVAGDYTVSVLEAPAGLVNSPLGTTNTNNQNQGSSFNVSLTPNAPNLNGDFGFTLPASIGDYVWYDLDNDGIQDATEQGIANVTIVLYDINGTPIMTTTTDAEGGYLFDGLTPGTYTVGVVDGVTGLTATSGAMVHNPTTPIVVGAGENMTSADFGYVLVPTPSNAVIGDTVWYDADGDGVQDPSEQGAAGIIITLTDGTNVYTTTTDSNGNYLIEVPAGNYTVTMGTPAGYDVSYDFSGAPDGVSTVTIAAGETNLDMDFGLVDSTPGTLLGSIGNQLWNDLNGDGDFDGDEPGLANVTLNLINSATGEIVNTVTTDANGEYLFTGVPAGNYEVQVADANGALNGYSETVNGATLGNNNHQTGPRLISLAAGEDNTAVDFGFVQAGLTTGLATIGNQIWLDKEVDGVFNPSAGDTPIAGVEVGLYRDGVLVLTTTTRADGTYLFEYLPAGNYSVQVLDTITDVNSPLYDLTAAPTPPSGSDDVNRGNSWAATLNPNGGNYLGDFAFQLTLDPTSVGLAQMGAGLQRQMLLVLATVLLWGLTMWGIRPKTTPQSIKHHTDNA